MIGVVRINGQGDVRRIVGIPDEVRDSCRVVGRIGRVEFIGLAALERNARGIQYKPGYGDIGTARLSRTFDRDLRHTGAVRCRDRDDRLTVLERRYDTVLDGGNFAVGGTPEEVAVIHFLRRGDEVLGGEQVDLLIGLQVKDDLIAFFGCFSAVFDVDGVCRRLFERQIDDRLVLCIVIQRELNVLGTGRVAVLEFVPDRGEIDRHLVGGSGNHVIDGDEPFNDGFRIDRDPVCVLLVIGG